MNYGLDEHLYSLNSLQNELMQSCVKKMDIFINTDHMSHVTMGVCCTKTLHKHVLLKHL